MKRLLLILSLWCMTASLLAQNSYWQNFDTKQQSLSATRLAAQKNTLGLGSNDELISLNIQQDELGYKHYRYQQNFRDYPVEGAQLLIHENQEGKVYAANGGLVLGIEGEANVVLNEAAALQKALQYSKGKTFAWQNDDYQKALQASTDNPHASFYPKGELVWASNSLKKEPQSYKLSYKFDVYTIEPLSRKFIFVDAKTGEVVTTINRLHDADAPCTGTARYSCSNPVAITADNQGTYYRLRESVSRKIETYTANNGTTYSFWDITSTDNNFNEDITATAVHWSTEKTYDYFKNTHNRNSFDGNNAKLMSWVHFGNGFDNAFWNGNFMTYGDGSIFSPLVSTDIVGHEIMHGITQYTANLTYSYEPGALNESFSDIFGTVIEFYADPTCADWMIGEDITSSYNGGQGIRNMQNPNLHGQPDTYEGTYWYTGSGDNGGVHYNSGVQNYWFYLLAQGGSGTNDHGTAYNVTAIGVTKAAQIAYRMLTVYLTPSSQYSDARAAAISAATDLYGAGSTEVTQVVNAWCAVGVGTCSLSQGTITVTSPNGGEIWQAGSTHNITWTSTGTVSNVNLYYSIDGGSNWNFIANQANTGSYTWTVPNSPTTLARVRAENSSNSTVADNSNANFTIQGCNVIASFSSDSGATVCVPSTINFTNTSTGATTYNWSVNGTSQSTATNFSYLFNNAGTYTVQLTAINGNCSDTYTQTITVQAAANAAFTHTESDLTLSTFATQLSANSYTWDFGDGSTATTQNATHTYAAAGAYNVCLTVVNGCGTHSTCQSVTLTPTTNQACWQSISGGSYHTIAIKTDGTLWAWGSNYLGQLGNGVTTDNSIPTQIGTATDWQRISTGDYHTVALKTDGTLWAWGSNSHGQLGNGTNNDSSIPIQIGTANDWQSISAGYGHTIAIKTDGTLWVWGYNYSGQLGNGTTINSNIPLQIGTTNDWQSVSAGYLYTTAIKTDGTLWAWGRNDYGQLGNGTNIDSNVPTQIGTTNDWQSISAGYLHTIAIKTNGNLWAWGYNYNGQLGNGTTTHSNVPMQIGTANNWHSVSIGYVHTIAIKTDGTFWAWGLNYYGQFGNGTATFSSTVPLQIGSVTNWQNISAGDFHTIAIKTDGTLWAWGRNNYGQLGNGNNTDSNVPIQPVGGNCSIINNNEVCWQSVSAGSEHTVAIKTDGTLWAWGYTHGVGSSIVPRPIGTANDWQSLSAGWGHTIAIKTDGTLWAWGDNGYGQLGNGTTINSYIPIQIGTSNDWQSLSAGGRHTIAIKTDGTLWAWGGNYNGQLGNGTTTNSNVPLQIGTSNDWQSLSAGGQHVVAIKTDGTLWAWGYNYSGQLGDGTNNDSNVPIQIGTANNWQSLSAGNYHTVAIKTDGTLWAWGLNGSEQLGNGTTVNSNVPIQPMGGNCLGGCWSSISAGGLHTFAMQNDGTLWAWGRNNYGQLGNGGANNGNVPMQIGTDNDWQSISTGELYTVALKTDGTLWAWGTNTYGQFGDGTTINNYEPTQIGTANDWQSISSGWHHTIAIKTDGTLWGWGANYNGQLGNGTTTNSTVPIQIGTDNNWQSISSSGSYTIALKADGTLWAWGLITIYMNFIYDYGNIPIQIGTANDWQSIYAGCGHSFAIKTNGTLWAWGWNSIGQLGTGTNSHVPIQVGTSTNWQSASAGGTHSVALKTDGTLWAWGSNQYGQLGNGTTNNSYVPIQIGTATDWQNVSAGLYWHTTALKTDGTLWAWGDNEYGQLGDSTYIDSNIPIPSIEGNCSTSTCSITAQFTLPTTPNCANTAYAFTNTSTGAANYQWKVNGTNVGTTTNLTYTFPTAGTYTIMLEATNGTCSDTYSQDIIINDSATQLELGSDILQCGSSGSFTLDCGISGGLFYNWDLNGTLVGTTQSITAAQTGMYRLSVMDACNQVGIDSVYVLLDDDCVYPGDVNYDNIVNYLDLLPIGLNYGATGNTRPNASFAFNAQPCTDWSATQSNGQNLKHADCNGNGIIDNNDPAAIQLNYSQTHGIAPANPVNSSSPINLSAALGTAPPSFGNSTIIRIDLYANNTQNVNVTAYGLGFDVHYQFPNCIKVNNAYIDFSGSWLGTVGVDMATVQKNFLNSNLKSGHVEVAMTRLNHQNVSGYGKIGSLVADVDIYASAGGLQAAASLLGQQMTVANGTFVPIGATSGSFNLSNPAAPVVSVAANPTTALIGGSCGSTLTATVSNCNGCTYQWKRNSTTISGASSASYSPTQTGTYYVIVTASSGLSASASVAVAYNNAIVNTSGTALPFCTPSGINANAEYIKSVQFGTDAANVTASDSGYGNYTCSKVFNLNVDCPATLTLQPKFVGATQTEYWTVWVDKNMDGDFVDAGEQIWQKITTNGNAFSKTFAAANIPSSLLGKTFRMRVAMKRGSYATSPCENFAQGEVEDYTLRFIASNCRTDETLEADTPFEAVNDFPVQLFPNPVTDVLQVYFTATNSSKTDIRVYDVVGRLVFEEFLWSVVGENNTQINTQQLPNGIYFLQITHGNEQKTQRFVKQ